MCQSSAERQGTVCDYSALPLVPPGLTIYYPRQRVPIMAHSRRQHFIFLQTETCPLACKAYLSAVSSFRYGRSCRSITSLAYRVDYLVNKPMRNSLNSLHVHPVRISVAYCQDPFLKNWNEVLAASCTSNEYGFGSSKIIPSQITENSHFQIICSMIQITWRRMMLLLQEIEITGFPWQKECTGQRVAFCFRSIYFLQWQFIHSSILRVSAPKFTLF